jgi:hypothetical protein
LPGDRELARAGRAAILDAAFLPEVADRLRMSAPEVLDPHRDLDSIATRDEPEGLLRQSPRDTSTNAPVRFG